MEEFWARVLEPSGRLGANYWEYFAERLVQFADISTGINLLDLGSYDGNVLFKAMRKMSLSGLGVGVDIYFGGFLDGITEAVRMGCQGSIAFVQADANALGICSNTFDIVLSNFMGWDDCFDFEQLELLDSGMMITEVLRILKPGGQVGIGSWVVQNDIDWFVAEFDAYFHEWEQGTNCYSKENSEGQKHMLKEAGFEDVHVYVDKMDFTSPGVEIWWRQMQQAANPYFQQISDPDILEDFKEQVFNDLGAFQYSQGIQFSKTVSFAFGTKPK